MNVSAPRERLIERFLQRSEAVGVFPKTVKNAAEARRAILDICLHERMPLILRAQSEMLQAWKIDEALQEGGLTVVEVDSHSKLHVLAKGRVGLIQAEAALAETGTLVAVTVDEATRLVSCLPPILIAAVKAEDIHEKSEDAFLRLKPLLNKHRAYCISFITGPSRTADIEQQLIKGVHGPHIVHCIIDLAEDG